MSHRSTGPALTKVEPVITVATLSALVAAVITLLVALGINIPEGLETAILAVIAAAAPIAAGLIARGQVTPSSKVVERTENDLVVAGEGHELLPAGEPIREAGSLNDPD